MYAASIPNIWVRDVRKSEFGVTKIIATKPLPIKIISVITLHHVSDERRIIHGFNNYVIFLLDLIFRCYIEVICLAYAQYHGADSKDLLMGIYYLI